MKFINFVVWYTSGEQINDSNYHNYLGIGFLVGLYNIRLQSEQKGDAGSLDLL